MSVRIATANIEQGAGRTEMIPGLVEGFERMDADVVVCPEAYTSGHEPEIDAFKALGYDVSFVPYNEPEPVAMYMRHPENDEFTEAYMVLDRTSAIVAPLEIAGWRDMVRLAIPIDDSYLHAVMGHFDDRHPDYRHLQTDSILSYPIIPAVMNEVSKEWDSLLPVLVGTDGNEIHNGSRINQLPRLNRVNIVTQILGSKASQFGANFIPHQKKRSLAKRLNRMTEGSNLKRFENHGYVDADPTEQPTIQIIRGKPETALVQLDRFMHDPNRLRVIQHIIHAIEGPDHMAVSVDVELVD